MIIMSILFLITLYDLKDQYSMFSHLKVNVAWNTSELSHF